MKDETNIQNALTDFLGSDEFYMLKNYPTDMVLTAVLQFSDLVFARDVNKLKDWDPVSIMRAFNDIQDVANKDADSRAFATLAYFYFIVREFLQFATRTDYIDLTRTQLNDTLIDFEVENNLAGDPVPYYSGVPDQQNDDMPRFQQHTLDRIIREVQYWVELYSRSSLWSNRPEGVDKGLLYEAITAMTDLIYTNFRKTPRTWTKKVITAVMTDDFVSYDIFLQEEIKLVVPALLKYLDYVGKIGKLPVTTVERYQRFITAAEPEMLAAYEARNKQLAEELGQGMSMDKALDMVIDDLDPDPEQVYLKLNHPKTHNSRTWNKETAIATHKLGVKLALEMWSTRDQYKLIQGLGVDVIIEIISGLVDVLYSISLETPAQLSTTTMAYFGRFSSTGYKRTKKDLIISYLELLGNNGTVSKLKSKELLGAFLGKIVPLNMEN